MNVSVEQVAALNYAATHLEATYALVTVDTHLMLTITYAMVRGLRHFGEDKIPPNRKFICLQAFTCMHYLR